ncbi:uncharacterized protein N7498_009030 [Penicillium cinerascens]|uniref:Uncharacterized protein n=1 Tax=Penicillium cinerascens TaxID=70096 RepID=A0A9W9MCU6_9EURO|nr:uncharacterized protein N7498_009030 [Penicillium cinerascens]KAJ5195592.1 hypothetical protein N7498_009030 [Penicillium cinerascens]
MSARTSERVFKIELQDGEPFHSDLIGASKEQCQNWALEKWFQAKVKSIEPNFIAIADDRSARDGTLLMSFYCPKISQEEPTFEFDGWGPLLPEANTWYNFRIDHRAADEIHGALMWATRDTAYPTYFGLPENFADESGIFDVFKAIPYVNVEESDEDV